MNSQQQFVNMEINFEKFPYSFAYSLLLAFLLGFNLRYKQ